MSPPATKPTIAPIPKSSGKPVMQRTHTVSMHMVKLQLHVCSKNRHVGREALVLPGMLQCSAGSASFCRRWRRRTRS